MEHHENCRTHPEYVPGEAALAAENSEPYFLLAAYDDDLPDTLGMVFLQRLQLPMIVYSERAGRQITLPDLASVHRWAATEFSQYEIGRL